MSIARFAAISASAVLAPTVFMFGYHRGWKHGLTEFEEDHEHEVKLLKSQIAMWKWNHDQMAAGKLHPFPSGPVKM